MRRAWTVSLPPVVLLCACILLVPGRAGAQSAVPLKDRFLSNSKQTAIDYYSARLERYYGEVAESLPVLPTVTDTPAIVVPTSSARSGGTASLRPVGSAGGRSGAFSEWREEVEWVEWRFTVARKGVYEIDLEYYLEPGGSSAAVRTLLVDGKVPFLEAYKVAFYRFFRDTSEPTINNIGDEVRPRQEEIPAWRVATLRDSVGMYDEPFRFAFDAGEHSVRLLLVDEAMILGNLILRPATRIPSYAETADIRRAYLPARGTVQIQSESAVLEKNDPTLRRESDGDPESEPVGTGYRRLNIQGAWRWRIGDQAITWSFTVPETGLYKIGLRVGKFWGDGLPAYRQIAIDGRVPFREMLAYKFGFDRRWRVETFADQKGEPYLFSLTGGQHTLTMTVKMAELAGLIYSVNDNVLLLSRVLRQIIMITGSEPDPNYLYELDKKIPDLLDNLRHLRDEMQWKVDLLTKVSTKRPAAANNLLTVKSQLEKALAQPDMIHRRVRDLTNAQESLGSWYLALQEQPLWIDYFLLGGPQEPFKQDRSNFFQRLAATVKNLFISFYKDYDSVGNVYAAESKGTEKKLINVWISRGTEWAEVIKEMADETFSARTGIMVNMNVLPPSQLNAGAVNALMLAITSGRAPDVACGLGATSPVEFAIRDAVLDLDQFAGHEEVFQRFLPRITQPFKYRGGTYAIPETMDFRAMFYRKDILQELGIRLPDTWEDVYTRVLPVLYQNGMDFYYAVPTELGAIDHNFAPFLYQAGGDFYTEDGMRTALDTPEAYRAFKEYCDLYTSYGLPIVANFYMRMRTGEMPVGIGTYGMYMALSVAAPELAGRWGVAEFPGHRRADGTIDRTVGGIALDADVIMSNTKHPQESWEFLKWWSSAEIQERFGRELEALIGPQARWNTANVEAFQRLPWKREDLTVIKSTWIWARDMPVVLGGYFTGRHIVNAWNRVVMSAQSSVLTRAARARVLVRDSVEQAVKDINRELRQKQEEYGVTSPTPNN